ncbi:hypothetical protein E2C01_099740 [Portunus trituberculatus]|uniref:Uncharacterized protein n=1 Tax=Portunus trituberculatus TaxID=210409 RepID=A0A5B7K4K5_PORTR|nr:hypothetical protein [Portunus trituberculatus]
MASSCAATDQPAQPLSRHTPMNLPPLSLWL